MDKKTGAVLAIAIIGVLTGVAGIVIANDAKSNNQDTQAQLDAAVAREDKRVAATAAAATAGIRKSEKSAEASVKAAEEADSKTSKQDSEQIATVQSSLDDLKSQISDLQASQTFSNQKLNARITALSNRVGG
ncbi:MAG: hypothetical protein WD181_03545 [Solirubrobacterales bacterium]